MLKKTELINSIINHQQSKIEELEAFREKLEGVTDLDENSSRDIDDFSHQSESMEVVLHTNQQIESARDSLNILRVYANSELTNVMPGAIIETDKRWFLIGVSISSYELEGKEIIGISTETPIYSVMVNKSAGDSFSFADQEYVIQHIY